WWAAGGAVPSAGAWRAIIPWVGACFKGLVFFLIVVVAPPFGIVLLPIALAGAPTLWIVLLLSRLYASAERSRFALMLDVQIPDPATAGRRPPAGGSGCGTA